jgi:hypothetical protein
MVALMSDSPASRFRAAVESHDIAAGAALLAPDVVFHSPVVFRPYEGRDAVAGLLGVVAQTFEDFEYVGEVESGDEAVLRFKTRVGDRTIEGVDIIHWNADGLIDQFTVMLRPLSGTMAMAHAMKENLAAAGHLDAASAGHS